MGNCKISIITINFNNATGLKKTIENVLSQTYTDFEYIVIDGGSSDGSVKIIREKEEAIHYWKSEPDAGIYNAMNKGIAVATGDYLLFQNSGDVFYSNQVLETVFACDWTADIIYGDVEYVRNDGSSRICKYPDELDLSFLFETCLNHQSMFIKRELFHKFGLYDETLKILADWEFYTRLFVLNNISMTHIPITVSIYCMDGFSSMNPDVYTNERALIINRLFTPRIAELVENHRIYKRFYYKKGSKAMRFFLNLFRKQR